MSQPQKQHPSSRGAPGAPRYNSNYRGGSARAPQDYQYYQGYYQQPYASYSQPAYYNPYPGAYYPGATQTPPPAPTSTTPTTVEPEKKKSGIVVSKPTGEVVYGKGTNNLRGSSGAISTPTTPTAPTPVDKEKSPNAPLSSSVAAAQSIQVTVPTTPEVEKEITKLSTPEVEKASPQPETVKAEESKPVESENKVVPLEKEKDSENKKEESTNENQILKTEEPKQEEKPEEITKEESKEEESKKDLVNAVTETPKPAEDSPKSAEESSSKQETQAEPTEASTKETEEPTKQENQATEAPETTEELPKPAEIKSNSTESGHSSEKEDDSWETKDEAELVQSVKEHALNNPLETAASLRIYSKDFLMKFKEVNTTKPTELQNLHIILPAAISKSDNSNNQSNYENRNYQKNQKGFPGNRATGKAGNRKNSYNNKKAPPSPKVNPKLANKENLTPKEKSLKSAKSVLNKIAPDTFDKLSKTIGELVTAELLEEITELIFEKAVTEPKYADLYAKLCVRLLQQDSTGFRTKLLSLCQKEFEQLKEHEANKELEVLDSSEDYQIRKRMRGNMEFVGELFNQPQGISAKIIYICFKELIHDNLNEELTTNQIKGVNVKLEAFCKLATTVGKKLDQQNQKSQDQSIDHYFKILRENYLASKLIEPRLKFAINDVVDLRSNRWIPRREAEKPKTIQEIHAAAAKVEQQKAAAASPSRGKQYTTRTQQSDTPKSSLRNSGSEWQTTGKTTGGKNNKGKKGPKSKPTSQLVTQKNAFEQLSTEEKEKPIDKEKFKGKSFIFMEEVYAGGEIDLSEFDVLSEKPTVEERNLFVENILIFLSEKNKDIKLAVKLLEELNNQKYIFPNVIEHGFTTIIKNFIDIVDDLPNFPSRIATMLSNLFPSILTGFAFLTEPLDYLNDEDLSTVATNFVADLIKFTTANGNSVDSLKLDNKFVPKAVIAITKKLLSNPADCANWLETNAPVTILKDQKFLEEISKGISNLFTRASNSESPSEDTLREENNALEKFSPVMKVVKHSDLLPVLKPILKNEGLYSRVEAIITKY